MMSDNPGKYRYSDNQKLFEDEEMIIDLTKNTIICGDNKTWLKDIPDESIDLCYIDPPFFSNSTYEKVWGNGWEVASFEDRFAGGIEHYIDWMRPRIELIHKKLKKTGSIFLHCDWHASHRLRCLLDDIFKQENFVNEIIWHYRRWSNVSSSFQRMHDSIFMYSKEKKNYKFNLLMQPYSVPEAIETTVRKKINGKLVRARDDNGNYIQREKKNNGVPMHDVWHDINFIPPTGAERIGYRTQKPESLIARIIECVTDKNDFVLDCFAGGFTTAKVCADLNRKFICGDVSPVACKIGMKRLNNHGFYKYESKGMYQTEEEFRKLNGHEFAENICDLMGWKVNPKKSNDKGIDGWDGNNNPVQIKNHKAKTDEKDLRDFLGALHSCKSKTGIFVAWDFTPDAVEFASKQKNDFDIQLRKCRELIGDLVISNEKRAEIENFYNERLPIEWKDPEFPIQKSA